MNRFLPLFCLLLGSWAAAVDPWKGTFNFETIPPPVGVDPQVGAMGTLPDGRLVVAFHRGEVYFYDPEEALWSEFARGLHEPLGLLVEDAQNILVMQRPELTRLTDGDGDGRAESFETVFDDFGMTGNYHEFAFGPAKDAAGNLYVALGVASNGAGIRPEIRGEWSEIGYPREKMITDGSWGKRKKNAGRMFGRVAYRGWIMKITPDGKGVPFASGVRSPNGIAFDADDRLLVCDNQGDWLGTSKLHHIREGHFHGHPASLLWEKGWDRDPLKVPIAELEAKRTRAAGLFPQSELANSPTQPILIPQDFAGFPALRGQMVIGEMNQTTLVRFLPDSGISGASQGTTIPFLQTAALGRGNNRLALGQDGSLWVGKTHLSWPGSEGLVKVTQKKPEQVVLQIQEVKATPEGFQFTFSKPIDPKTLTKIQLERHTYNYNQEYGSPKVDLQPVVFEKQEGERDLLLKVKDFHPGYLYTFNFQWLKAVDGDPLLGHKGYYHLIAAPEQATAAR